jgi:hypothetical protein
VIELVLFPVLPVVLGFVGYWVARDARKHLPNIPPLRDVPPWIIVVAVLFTFPLGLWGWLAFRYFYEKREPSGERGGEPRSP